MSKLKIRSNVMALRTFHLFAGAGGGILADILLGHIPVGACEIGEYQRATLLQRQRDGILPRFPIWDDIRTLNGTKWNGAVDVVCGGFPCQSFSTAARGRNIESKNLWLEMLRITAEMCPAYVFAENVSRKAINKACDDLETMGYATRAIKISAKDMGADHIRNRYWLFAYSNMHSKLRLREYAEMAQLQKLCPRFWESNPREPRMDDGLAHRMDRLKSIGNGQVPIVAAFAWIVLIMSLCENIV